MHIGEWSGEVTADELPTIPGDERLFDREALAAAVTGSN